jgi:Na+-transporting methylmalonyl-CoA/oxaloacetate decarboxylase gamma subunit
MINKLINMSKAQSTVLEGVTWPEVKDKAGKVSRSSTQTASAIIAAAIDAHNSEDSKAKAKEMSNISAKNWRFGYQKYLTYLTRVMAESDTE